MNLRAATAQASTADIIRHAGHHARRGVGGAPSRGPCHQEVTPGSLEAAGPGFGLGSAPSGPCALGKGSPQSPHHQHEARDLPKGTELLGQGRLRRAGRPTSAESEWGSTAQGSAPGHGARLLTGSCQSPRHHWRGPPASPARGRLLRQGWGAPLSEPTLHPSMLVTNEQTGMMAWWQPWVPLPGPAGWGPLSAPERQVSGCRGGFQTPVTF